ncbi:MAG: hypothetical protein J5J00_10070 [Deltaproteobacteria bacterium]|nr:hypothetical protein [Deltaproteobacteria bacterium]
MANVETTEIWRQIPPEEKFSLLSRAHSKGIASAIITIVVACTFAISLHNAWLMWGAIVVSPIIFQLAAGKAWRDLRPRLVLEYLAARSAARRYAFTAGSRDLAINFLFRGRMELTKENTEEDPMAALEASLENPGEIDVWIGLFGDAVVLMSERAGGAHCELAQVLGHKIELESRSLDDKGDYSSNKELYITALPERGASAPKKYRITSDAPAALIVFEKRLQVFLERARAEADKEAARLISGGTIGIE